MKTCNLESSERDRKGKVIEQERIPDDDFKTGHAVTDASTSGQSINGASL